MKYFMLMILLISLVFSTSEIYAQKQLTLEEIFKSDKFKEEELDSPHWMPDSKSFVFLKQEDESEIKSIFIHDVSTGSEKRWIDSSALKHPETGDTLRFTDYVISSLGNKVVFKTDEQRVWRHFDDARFFIYDIDSKTMTAVNDGKERIRHVKLSPDEKSIGYVLNNNIYIKNFATGKTIAATTDGNGIIINGLSDWVYEEEFGKGDRWSWSEDGTYIAFHQFDQTPIKTFSWTEFGQIDVKVRTVPYPKAGDPNSIVKIGVYELASGTINWMDIGYEKDIYIPRIRWTKKNDVLMIERMNRLQNKLEFLLADVKTGKTSVKFTETDPAWISITDDIFFLNDKQRFMRTSEEHGYNQIYLFDCKTGKKMQITKGEWEVSDVYGINEEDGQIYFQANKGRMEERQLFKTKLNGKKFIQLSKGIGAHAAEFAPDFSYFIERYSSVEIPTKTCLMKNDGSKIRTLVENKMQSLDGYDLAYPEFTSFKTSDGVEIKAMITKPVDFYTNKKYPVLIY